MSWIAVGIGAGGGALVGSYGHDNWGWSKDSIWQGALVGGAGGAAVGGMGAGAGAGAGLGAPGTAGTTAAKSALLSGEAGALGISGGGGGAMSGGGMMAGLSKPLIAGQAWSNPLMLGAAGMGLASAFSSSGQTPQQKVELSSAGKKLQSETLKPAIKAQYEKAIAGNAGDKAFGAISNLKTQEGTRARASSSVLRKAQAQIYNVKPNDRGGAAMGGAMIKGQMADAGERMDGLFAPTSALNAFTKEGLMNSVAQIQNMQNRENVVGQFNYQGNLAAWNANQMAATNKGAAIGQTAMMMGGSQLNQAYMKQYSNAMA
jgi:hypothetical protein